LYKHLIYHDLLLQFSSCPYSCPYGG
jgi:hypothetical protein